MAGRTETMSGDLYEVLGVAPDASDEQIGRAYRSLARRYHPDVNRDRGAEERFKEISEAYDTLGDPARRADYDASRAARHRPPGYSRVKVHVRPQRSAGGVDDLIDDLFGGFGYPPGQHRRVGARRGDDLHAELGLTLTQAARGTTTDLRVERREACAECVGTGRNASGACPACEGSGHRSGSRRVRVRVPAGVEDGTVIRLPGWGAPGVGGAAPGDLLVRVSVTPDAVFARHGRDLATTVEVTYPEAVLGTDVSVATIDGPPVTLRVPAGTPSGRVLRVRGAGVGDHSTGRGDLLVTVKVAVPTSLSDSERRAVEALAEATPSPRRQPEARR